MTTLDNILKLLDKWSAWKRIKEAPERVDAIEKRIDDLEQKLARAPGDACPRCGEWAYRVKESKKHQTMGELGARIHFMECEVCGFTDEKLIGS